MHLTSRIAVALLALTSASQLASAERRPDWEMQLVLSPMVDTALAVPQFASADLLPAPSAPGGWEAINSDALDGMRGGFTAPNGLAMSLGVDRLVSINGAVVARTSFELSGLGGPAGTAATQARDAIGNIGLIQNGPGNTFVNTMGTDALGATIIQNTLNDQTIRNQTVIHATVNSATLMHALNLNESVAQALRSGLPSN